MKIHPRSEGPDGVMCYGVPARACSTWHLDASGLIGSKHLCKGLLQDGNIDFPVCGALGSKPPAAGNSEGFVNPATMKM